MELRQICGLFPQESSEMDINASSLNQNLFHNIDRLLCGDNQRARLGFDKAAAFVNDVFCSLANLDVRFEFDPLSLDDCRCEMVATNEYNLLCILKQLPYGDIDVLGDWSTGAIHVRFRDDYEDSFEKAGWLDVCSVKPSSGERHLNTKIIMAALHRAIKIILTSERQEGALIVCQYNDGYLTLVINLHLAGVYKFNLLPTIRVNRKLLVFHYFDKKITSVFNSLDEMDTVESIQIVAKPAPSFPDTAWRITFNDLEKRLVNLEKYPCLAHCLFAIRLLQQKHLVANDMPRLSSYNLQMVALREMVKRPRTGDWEGEKLPRRLNDLLKSVKACLRQRANVNVFTDVNILRGYRKSDVKMLCSEFGYLTKYYKDILFF